MVGNSKCGLVFQSSPIVLKAINGIRMFVLMLNPGTNEIFRQAAGLVIVAGFFRENLYPTYAGWKVRAEPMLKTIHQLKN